MIEEGLWKSKKKKVLKVYQRRERRSRFGAMLQGDGAPHDWFEGRAPKCSFLQFVDDATSKTTAARFVEAEGTEGYLELLKEQLKTYGRPLALYVDNHVTFRVNREEIKKGTGITHFGRVLKELICAHSLQAKGRVERKHGVFQDRLVKEMRLRGISSIEEGNRFLPEFLKEMNLRFGIEAANPEDAHRSLRKRDDLDRIFARREARKLSKNLTFQHRGILYLIQTKTPNRLKHATVEVVCKGEEIEVEYEGKRAKRNKTLQTALYKRREQTKTYICTVAGLLCRSYDCIAIGDYTPHGNGKGKKMRRAMNNRSLIGRFKAAVSWTAKKLGKTYIEYDEKNTTRSCSSCNYCHPTSLCPSIRKWQCPECQIIHERDENSAQNGLRGVLRDFSKN